MNLKTSLEITDPDSLFQKVKTFTASSAFKDAESLGNDFLNSHPENYKSHWALADLYFHMENFDQSYQFYKTALALTTAEAFVWFGFGQTLEALGNPEAALIAYDRAGTLSLDSVEFFIQRSRCLRSLKRLEEASDILTSALSKYTDHPALLTEIASLHEELGQFDQAQECYEKVLAVKPGDAFSLYRLSKMKKLGEHYNMVQKALSKPAHVAKLSWYDQSLIYLTLGQELERQKKYDEAFRNFTKANELIKSRYRFDRDQMQRCTDLYVNSFQTDLYETLRMDPAFQAASLGENIIFILGMPRSGTSLVEQILAAHSQITGAGELDQMAKIEKSLLKASRPGMVYPVDLKKFAHASFVQFGQLYLSANQKYLTAGTRYMTDKMPFNFLFLGLIKLILPKARILHVVRDPRDTCLSCYFSLFSNHRLMSFTNDLDDLAFYYSQYQRLMAHWKMVFPGEILDVHYENLVGQQEQETLRLLQFLELDWEEACLNFYDQKRSVVTESLWQVRQPVYKESVGRWRSYEKKLGPILGLQQTETCLK